MLIRFLYELLYPAILGSMIYQVVLDAKFYFSTSFDKLDPSWYIQVLIVWIYTIDWWYTRYINFKYKRNLDEAIKFINRVTKRCLAFSDFYSVIGFFIAFKFVHESNSVYDTIVADFIIYTVILAYYLVHISFLNRLKNSPLNPDLLQPETKYLRQLLTKLPILSLVMGFTYYLIQCKSDHLLQYFPLSYFTELFSVIFLVIIAITYLKVVQRRIELWGSTEN